MKTWELAMFMMAIYSSPRVSEDPGVLMSLLWFIVFIVFAFIELK